MKTPKVDIKDVLGKLGFLKNNLGLLVPVIIAVVAALLFIPTRILRGKLQDTIQRQSVQAGREITSLAEEFRRAARAEAMEKYISEYAKDANQIELLAKQTTLRELLSYKLFPDTNEMSPLLFEEFGEKYVLGIEAMLQDLGAGAPPTDAEIDAALESAPRGLQRYGGYPPPPAPVAPTASGYPRRRIRVAVTEMDRKIMDKVCLDKAREAKVYASPIDLDGYMYWSEWKFETREKAYQECWYWQLGYWITEDVLATVRAINESSDHLLNAPVKRIMNVSFNLGRSRTAGMGRGLRRSIRRDMQMPAYVTSAKTAISTPCTGRFCNEEIDVVHFDVRIIVRAADVIPFMQELCRAKEHKFRGFYGDLPEQTYQHNQITILESNIGPVNQEGWEHNLYRYGDDAVAELDLICEYIFHKAAYEDIKPQVIKDDILNAGQPTTR